MCPQGRILVACGIALFGAGSGCARRAPSDPLDALLARLSTQARSVRSFSLAFVEEKTLPEIPGTIQVRGTLWGKASQDGLWLKLVADAPRPSVILVSPADVRVWSPVERQFEIAPTDRAPDFAGLLKGFFLLYAASRSEIERDFTVETTGPSGGTDETCVRLVSRGPESFLDGPLEIIWTGKGTAPSRIAFATRTGERYRWIFSGFTAGREPEGGFVLEPPPGVPVVDLTRIE